MLTLQALSSSLNAGAAKGGCLGRGKALGVLRQFVPQNGRVHLHITDSLGTEAQTEDGPSRCRSSKTDRGSSQLLIGPLPRGPKVGNGRGTVGKEYWTKMVQNGADDHFGQNDLVPNWILAFARPQWTKMVHFGPFWPEEVHFGPFRSANRTLAIPGKDPKNSRFRARLNISSENEIFEPATHRGPIF